MATNANQPIPLKQFSHPRYWPTWIGILLIWGLAQLPLFIQIGIGRLLGTISFYLAGRRRHICDVNLRLCFPDLAEDQHQKLLRRTFASMGIGIMETAMAWGRNPENYRHKVDIDGLEHLQNALAQGRGVLLVGGHFSTLDFGGSLLSLFQEIDATYRKHKNPLFDAVMGNSRKRLYGRIFERKDVRGAIRSLKDGRMLWYAPDQDYGSKHSVFVPFFGVEAATITATTRFAKVNNSVVLFFSHHRTDNDRRYQLTISPPITDYPSGDEHADARRINAQIEQEILRYPDQYLWLHRRFKSQPEGKADPY